LLCALNPEERSRGPCTRQYPLRHFNAALAYFQEGRVQANLAARKSRLALNASVQRDSEWWIVPAAESVCCEVDKLSLGGSCPACGDCGFIAASFFGHSRKLS